VESGDGRIKSLAVLPLENLSGNPAEEYFADGVTEELITDLAKIASLSVTSRTSVMRYKGVHTKALPQIARELGVDAVLEGSLIRTGDRVRVTAQLIEASTDRHLWADAYDRSSRDILLLENDIARTIAERVRAKLSPQEQRHLSANPIAPAAHEAYLRGLYLWNLRTKGSLDEAVQNFTEAIEKEPRYAEAYAGRADAYIVLGGFALEMISPKVAFPKARADAGEALTLDSSNSEAHCALPVVREAYEWDWRGAETEFRRALHLSASNATARQWYGHICVILSASKNVLMKQHRRMHSIRPT
jgi:TolB-like protein